MKSILLIKTFLGLVEKTFGLQLVIEGVIGNGLEGDIALDDLAVLSGNCNLITQQGLLILNDYF